ncbi:unnamed protein product [Nezara viridula]|uniref:Uncharacterized protein n=1 Tax=Nezara viridula TaxID=85310 RepID=A0A9P0MUT8_NEZVI|nr:unnamed protein product [Nezara viridula]
MVLDSGGTSLYIISGAQNDPSQKDIINEEAKKEMMEIIKAGQDRWKMSFNWKTEESTLKKYEEKVIEDFGQAFEEIGEDGLEQVEAVMEDHAKSANMHRVRELIHTMKKKYKLEAPSIIKLFDTQNEKFLKTLNLTEKIFKTEWDRFLEYQAKKDWMQKIIKEEHLLNLEDDVRKVDSEEMEYKRRMARLMDKIEKKRELCKAALQLASGKLSGGKESRKLVEKLSDDALQLKENLMKIIAAFHKGLKELRSKRKKKTRNKKYRGFIDEQCDICQKNEEVWEEERLRTTQLSEHMTAEDARDFHTRMVRSGGMRGLVDQLKIIIDDDLPSNIALPKFFAATIHPEKADTIYKEIVNYNCMRSLRKELSKIDRHTVKIRRQSIFEDNEQYLPRYCPFCGRN